MSAVQPTYVTEPFRFAGTTAIVAPDRSFRGKPSARGEDEREQSSQLSLRVHRNVQATQNHLQESRRRHRRSRSRHRGGAQNGSPDLHAWRSDRYRQLRRRVPFEGLPAAGSGVFGRWRRHQAQGRVSHRLPQYRRRGPGEPLRERYRGARRRAAFLSGLFLGGQTGREGCCGSCLGYLSRLPRQRVRADWRRDRRDARALCAWRIRLWPVSSSALWNASA